MPHYAPELHFYEFADAIQNGDESKLRVLLEGSTERSRGTWIETDSGKSVLHMAACSDHGFMEVLLAHRDIRRLLNGADNEGATPLITAVACGNVSAVKLLLATGASTTSALFNSRRNALHIAVEMNKAECIAVLLEYDTSEEFLDAFDADGNTPLMLSAVWEYHYPTMLLAAGATHLLKNPVTGRNILHMAVLESNKNLTSTLVEMWCPQAQFMNSLDSYGDSPFKLAVRLQEVELAKILLSCPVAHEMIWEFPDAAHHAIAINDSELISKVISILDKDDLTTWTDSKGLTALMVAVEMNRPQSVKDLLEKGVGTTTSRDQNGLTVLHKAVIAGNADILNLILETPNIHELAELQDYEGRTAIETALAMDQVDLFAVLWKSGVFQEKHLTSKSDSALFIAAKDNNYGGFLLLLLSPNCIAFVASLLNNEVVTDVDLERAYLKKQIYASDLYIMTGVLQKNKTWNYHPPLPEGFHCTENGRNLFHACAMGGFVDLMIFLYRYCELFYPEQCRKLDERDCDGATPLMLAAECEHREVVRFLLQKGANLCRADDSGDSPLIIIHKSIPDYRTFLEDIFSDFIISDGWTVPEATTSPGSLSVHFSLLCPEGEPYIRVTSTIFQSLSSVHDSDTLMHPLLRCYVGFMWAKAHGFWKMRYLGAVLGTFVFSAYIITKNCILVPKYSFILGGLWWMSVICFMVGLIWSLPLSFLPLSSPTRWFEGKAVILPAVLGITYLVFFNESSRTSLEIEGWAVLASWLSLMSMSTASPLQKQKAMYHVVFSSMLPYLPVYFLVTTAFGFYFFVLFHNYFIFNNPVHSALFAAFQLPRGDLDFLPVMSEATSPFRASNASYRITKESNLPGDHERIDKNQEARAMVVEGVVLIVFLAVATAVTNLLTALAVRSGEDIILAGDVVELSSQVDRLEKWEIFLFSGAFQRLRQLRLLGLISTSRSAKKNFPPPKIIHPLVTKPMNFELFMIKSNFIKRENLVSNKPIKFLLEWFYGKGRVRMESRLLSFNKLILDS